MSKIKGAPFITYQGQKIAMRCSICQNGDKPIGGKGGCLACIEGKKS